jgi:hypothetical protein
MYMNNERYISNVQNNMGVEVEYYYLLQHRNLKLEYFDGFNHKKQ